MTWENRIVGHDDVPPGDLVANPDNWRTHPRHQANVMEDTLDELGWLQHIVVNKNSGLIVDGHLRVELALKRGVDTVPVTYVDITEAEEAQALATLDPVSALARADKDALARVLDNIDTPSESIQKLIDDTAKKAGLYTNDEEAKQEALSAAQEERQALVDRYGLEQGQAWQAGPHRLVCGDSTDPATYQRLMGIERASCLFTDPPYGVDYEARSGKFEIIVNDELKFDQLAEFLVAALRPAVKVLQKHGSAYIWHASSTREDFAHAIKAVGLEERQYLIWAKPAAVLGWGDYRWGHEPCFYCSHADETPQFFGDRENQTVWRLTGRLDDGNIGVTAAGGLLVTDGDGHQLYLTDKAPKGKKPRHVRIYDEAVVLSDADSDLWEVARVSNTAHPTEKPSELARKALLNSTQEQEIVLDPFAGSGSTLVGAHQTRRRARLIELMPEYAAVILDRAEKLGLTPKQVD
jgi:DNA modification methylase